MDNNLIVNQILEELRTLNIRMDQLSKKQDENTQCQNLILTELTKIKSSSSIDPEVLEDIKSRLKYNNHEIEETKYQIFKLNQDK